MAKELEELKLEPEVADENGVTASEVTSLMDGLNLDEDAEPGKEKSVEDSLRDIGANVEGKIEDGDARIQLGTDSVFEEDKRLERLASDMTRNVRGVDIRITDSDKVSYIKSVLMDTDVELEVELAGGNIKAVFRSTSVYEQDLVPIALAKYAEQHPSANMLVLQGMEQSMFIAMELVRFNDRPVQNVRFVHGEHTMEEDAEKLLSCMHPVLSSAGPKYSFYVAAADVFHNKLVRLGEAALNKDFWDPAFAG